MAIYLIAAFTAGWTDIMRGIKKIGLEGLGIILALSLVNYGLRFWRWNQYLRAFDYHVPWRHSLAYYIAGFGLCTTPGKVGEAVRSIYLRRFNVTYEHSLAALFTERLFDVLGIAGLSLLILFSIEGYAAASICTIVGLFGLTLMIRSQKLRKLLRPSSSATQTRGVRIRTHTSNLLDSSAALMTVPYLTFSLILSFTAWGAEAFGFYLLLDRLEIASSLSLGMGIYAISILVGALSFIPAGLGSAEATMIGALKLLGAPLPDAIAATVLCRMATLWFAVMLGLGVILGLGLRQPTTIKSS